MLIDYPSLDEMKGDNCKFVFREAKVNDAILFFDECDAIFENENRRYGKEDTYLITEVERCLHAKTLDIYAFICVSVCMCVYALA